MFVKFTPFALIGLALGVYVISQVYIISSSDPYSKKKREMQLKTDAQKEVETHLFPNGISHATFQEISQNGMLLQYYEQVQTPETCLAAVQQNGLAIQYVLPKHYSDDLWLAAIRQTRFAYLFLPPYMLTPSLVAQIKNIDYTEM